MNHLKKIENHYSSFIHRCPSSGSQQDIAKENHLNRSLFSMWGLGGVASLYHSAFVAFLVRGRMPPRTGAVGARRFASVTSSTLAATRYLLHYDYVPDVLEKRGPHREGHLGLAKELIAEGKCLSGGPTGTPGAVVPSGALFIFLEKDAAEQFVSRDPYVSAGIVTGYSIKEWVVAVEKEN